MDRGGEFVDQRLRALAADDRIDRARRRHAQTPGEAERRLVAAAGAFGDHAGRAVGEMAHDRDHIDRGAHRFGGPGVCQRRLGRALHQRLRAGRGGGVAAVPMVDRLADTDQDGGAGVKGHYGLSFCVFGFIVMNSSFPRKRESRLIAGADRKRDTPARAGDDERMVGAISATHQNRPLIRIAIASPCWRKPRADSAGPALAARPPRRKSAL